MGDPERVAGHAAVRTVVLRLDVDDGDDGTVAADFDIICSEIQRGHLNIVSLEADLHPDQTLNNEGHRCRSSCEGPGVVLTWQMLVTGHFPLQPDRLGSAVDPAPEGRRLPDTHHGAVGLDGDDGALETCSRKRSRPSEQPCPGELSII